MNTRQKNGPPQGGDALAGLAARSDIGCVRPSNQDAYTAERAPAAQIASHGHLLIVADGMGGHAGGEIASRLAVDTFREKYFRAQLASGDDPAPVLRAALYEANNRIVQRGEEHPELRGMGTTCTAAVIRGDHLWIAHVGDSRLYRFRSAALELLTVDHNLAASLLSEGKINAAEAETHRGRHILTRALGVRTRVEPDVTAAPLRIEAGDRLLLCTDGLNRGVSDQQLVEVLAEEEEAGAAVERLVEMAKAAGGPDNITLVLADFAAAG
jgi:protein phosphatase